MFCGCLAAHKICKNKFTMISIILVTHVVNFGLLLCGCSWLNVVSTSSITKSNFKLDVQKQINYFFNFFRNLPLCHQDIQIYICVCFILSFIVLTIRQRVSSNHSCSYLIKMHFIMLFRLQRVNCQSNKCYHYLHIFMCFVSAIVIGACLWAITVTLCGQLTVDK